MSKFRGPRLRVVRRLGKLFALTHKKPKRFIRPGQHGRKERRRKPTHFSNRLAEKQKLRFYYGVSEKQVICYLKAARRAQDPTGPILLRLLEIRLDTLVYRLGWVVTLPEARQLVIHGHFSVNQERQRLHVPSFSCVPGHCISVRGTGTDLDEQRPMLKILVLERIIEASNCAPSLLFLISSTHAPTAFVHQRLDRSETGVDLKERLIIEYYSNRL